MDLVQLAKDMMKLFPGLTRAYGVYNIPDRSTVQGEKIKGEGIQTKRATWGIREWTKHLEGKQGLGVIPINEDNQVLWAVLDIDKYDLDFNPILKKMQGTPLVPFRSKSGGMHVFVFFEQAVKAASAQKVLKRIANRLGFGGCEIFPKQSVLRDKKDVGAWLNMPYFNATETNRFALTGEGLPVPYTEIVQHIKSKRTTLKALGELEFESFNEGEETEVPGGPPCLQYLTKNGFPPGSRNSGLFDLGVYYKKTGADDWTELIEQANQKWMKPGTGEEVQAVIKSLSKKSYMYKCEDPPINMHCDKDTCIGCKYGIGEDEGLPLYNGLTILKGSMPLYYLNVNSVRVGPLTGEELYKQDVFLVRIWERVRLAVNKVSSKRWVKILNGLTVDAMEVDMPKDFDLETQVFDLLEEYVIGKSRTENRDELLLNRVWENEGVFYFKAGAFVEWLKITHQFTAYSLRKLTGLFTMHGMQRRQIHVSGKGVNVWLVKGIIEPDPIDVLDEDEGRMF